MIGFKSVSIISFELSTFERQKVGNSDSNEVLIMGKIFVATP